MVNTARARLSKPTQPSFGLSPSKQAKPRGQVYAAPTVFKLYRSPLHHISGSIGLSGSSSDMHCLFILHLKIWTPMIPKITSNRHVKVITSPNIGIADASASRIAAQYVRNLIARNARRALKALNGLRFGIPDISKKSNQQETTTTKSSLLAGSDR